MKAFFLGLMSFFILIFGVLLTVFCTMSVTRNISDQRLMQLGMMTGLLIFFVVVVVFVIVTSIRSAV